MYKLCFYVQEIYLEPVKQALFVAGAGAYDDFSHCAWQTKGEGQYQLAGSELTSLTEYKVELYCRDEYISAALAALMATHPCDKPAYDLVKVKNSFT